MFLTEKNDKRIKGRLVYNGKPTRGFVNKEDSASPTAASESINITCAESGCYDCRYTKRICTDKTEE